MKWLKVKFGEGVIFSPNCLHGNVTNKENTTRWSINIRYKNYLVHIMIFLVMKNWDFL